jgi:hypothetical protein
LLLVGLASYWLASDWLRRASTMTRKIKRRNQRRRFELMSSSHLFWGKRPHMTELRQINQSIISQASYGLSGSGQRLTYYLGSPDNLNTRVGGGEPPTPKIFKNFQKIPNFCISTQKLFRVENFQGAPKISEKFSKSQNLFFIKKFI